MSVYAPPGGVWWSYVSGPARLVEDTANALLMGKSVCVCCNSVLPYRDTYFQLVAETMRRTEDMILDDVTEPADDPGVYLIERFNRHPDYRGNIPAATFLLQQRVLAGRLFPAIMQGEESRNWLDFIKSYRSASIRDGLFLLIAEKSPNLSASKNVHVLQYSDFVTEYDSLVFAGLSGSDTEQSMEARRYITALAVSIWGKDAEGVASFVQDFQIGKEPCELVPIGSFSDDVLERRIWEAQIQEIFPLIMRKTRELVDTWRPQFNAAFEYIDASRAYPNSMFPNGLRNSNDELVSIPDELEIGTIKYLLGVKRIDNSGNYTADYVLFLPDEDARLCAELLRNFRNQLAHGKVCPAKDVERLLHLAVNHNG